MPFAIAPINNASLWRAVVAPLAPVGVPPPRVASVGQPSRTPGPVGLRESGTEYSREAIDAADGIAGMSRRAVRVARAADTHCRQYPTRLAADAQPVWWGECRIKRPLQAPQAPRERPLYVDGKVFVRFDHRYFSAIEHGNELFVVPAADAHRNINPAAGQRLKINHYPKHFEVDVSPYIQPYDAVPDLARDAEIAEAPAFGQLSLAYADSNGWLQVGDTDHFVKADAALRYVVAPASSGLPNLPLKHLGRTFMCEPPKNWRVPNTSVLAGSGSSVRTINGDTFIPMRDISGPYLIRAAVDANANGNLVAQAIHSPEKSPAFCAGNPRFELTRDNDWEPAQSIWQLDGHYWRGTHRSFREISVVAPDLSNALKESLGDVRLFAVNAYRMVLSSQPEYDVAHLLFPEADAPMRSAAIRTLVIRVTNLFSALELQRRLDGTDMVLAEMLSDTCGALEDNQPVLRDSPLRAIDTSGVARDGFVAGGRIYVPEQFAVQARSARLSILASHLLRLRPAALKDYLLPIPAAEALERVSQIIRCDAQAIADASRSHRFAQIMQRAWPHADAATAQRLFCEDPVRVVEVALNDADTVIKLLTVGQQRSIDPEVQANLQQLDLPRCD